MTVIMVIVKKSELGAHCEGFCRVWYFEICHKKCNFWRNIHITLEITKYYINVHVTYFVMYLNIIMYVLCTVNIYVSIVYFN